MNNNNFTNNKFKINLPLFEEFLLDLVNNNYSSDTVSNYRRDLEIFNSFLDESKISFTDVTKLLISKYKEYLRNGLYLKTIYKNRDMTQNPDMIRDNEKSSPKASRRRSMYSGRLGSRSVNRMLSALRSYLRFLIDSDQENIPIPPDAIKMVKTEKKESQVAELDELIKLIESPEVFEKKENVKFRNRAILELLFSSGMRISELINLNREDLKISKDEKIDESKIYILGKAKKQRFVYLTPRAKFYLERYIHLRQDDYQALFIPYRGLRSGTKDTYQVRLSNNYVQAKIKEYRKLIGIVVPTSAHSLRHGFATYLAENGASPAAIQRLLGHESLQTTSKYVHTNDKYAQQVHDKFHPLKDVTQPSVEMESQD
jgi:site-specific recombinase XerD